MFIHRDKESESQIAEILIEKHRNGATGMVELVFDGSKTTFIEVEKRDFSDFAPVTSTGNSGFVDDNF
jgi:hypothetical protein